jgi:hypothetical protein
VSQQLLPPTPSISRHALAAFYAAGPEHRGPLAHRPNILVIEGIGMSGDAFAPLLELMGSPTSSANFNRGRSDAMAVEVDPGSGTRSSPSPPPPS